MNDSVQTGHQKYPPFQSIHGSKLDGHLSRYPRPALLHVRLWLIPQEVGQDCP